MRSESAEINGISICYSLSGEGACTLLLIHGIGSEGGILRGVGAHFARSAQVLVPTLRGHIPSGLTPPFTVAQFADDLAALLDALGLDNVIAVGISQGSQIAFELAARLSARVKAVVAVGGMARPPPVEVAAAETLYAALRKSGGMERFAEHFSGRLTSKAAAATRPALRAYAKMNMLRHEPAQMVELLKGFYSSDIRPQLSKVRCPTWLVIGTDDQISTLQDQVELKRLLKGCHVRVLPDAGHDYPADAPSQLNGILTEVLIEVLSSLDGPVEP